MLSAPLSRVNATDAPAPHTGNSINTSDVHVPSAHDLGDLLSNGTPKPLTRHYTSLQEHADNLIATDASSQEEGLTPRHSNRREGFSWGPRASLEDHGRHNPNPMTMEQERLDTPPPLEEIIRRATIVDADHLQNSKLQHIDSMESHTSTSIRLTKSFSTNTSESYTPDNRRTSIAAFAKGIVRHVPDLKILHPVDSKPVQTRRDSKGSASGKTQKKDRVLSFAPLPSASSKELHDKFSKPSVIPEGPPVHSNKPSKTTNTHSPPAKGGLRDRRKVQLDLSMPIEMPDLPARGRPPADITGSLGAPRQRSPKTPWIRSRPTWEPLPIAKSAPIVEERHARDDGLCLLPGSDALIALQTSPKFERPSPKVRDRCYISRPQSKRTHSHRSGQSGYSGYSGSASASTATTPAEEHMLQERQPRTKADLQQLAQTTTRSRRWVWGGKISSEDAPPSPVSEGVSRRFSFNPFRRANRISDQSVESPKGTTSSSSRAPDSKQRPPSTSLAYMDAPPSFVPPGLKRVPTPPIFDANGEVRGKLADFFFDVQGPGGPSTRNKPKSSPGGYWDSDALLMSVSHDLDNLDDEEEDEGPEGPRSDFVPTPVEFDTSGTPDLTRGDAGYLGVKPPATPSLAASGPMLGHDGWYRLHHQLSVESPDDERTLSHLALQAAEERRKFEWLVPEHLPNSPLCPLHEKYKGPSFGFCYWHGRRSGKNIRRGEYARPRPAAAERSSGGSGQSQSQMGDYVGDLKQQGGTPTREVKKRRLVSLSSP